MNADRIPKKIHYCWFGRGPMSDLNKRCLDSWAAVMPDFEIKEWNETNSPLDNPYCQASRKQRRWSKLSNYVRLHALHVEGGIYLDTDVEALKSFTPLLAYECFLGFQQQEDGVDWVNNAILGAAPGHRFLKRCIDRTMRLFGETGELYRSPTISTAVLKEAGLRKYGLQEIDGVTIHPIEYFYPYPWFGSFSAECVTESTYCIHHWEASWRNKKYEKVRASLAKLKRTLLSIVSNESMHIKEES